MPSEWITNGIKTYLVKKKKKKDLSGDHISEYLEEKKITKLLQVISQKPYTKFIFTKITSGFQSVDHSLDIVSTGFSASIVH